MTRIEDLVGRKQVVGKPILYKTTREFLLQFGLRDLAELPTLKEFQELARFDSEPAAEAPEPVQAAPQAEAPRTTDNCACSPSPYTNSASNSPLATIFTSSIMIAV